MHTGVGLGDVTKVDDITAAGRIKQIQATDIQLAVGGGDVALFEPLDHGAIAFAVEKAIGGEISGVNEAGEIVSIRTQREPEGRGEFAREGHAGDEEIFEQDSGSGAVIGANVGAAKAGRFTAWMVINDEIEGLGRGCMKEVRLGVNEGGLRKVVPRDFSDELNRNLEGTEEAQILLAFDRLSGEKTDVVDARTEQVQERPAGRHRIGIGFPTKDNGDFVLWGKELAHTLPFGSGACAVQELFEHLAAHDVKLL